MLRNFFRSRPGRKRNPLSEQYSKNDLPDSLTAAIGAINKMDDPDALKFLSSRIAALPANVRIKAIEIFCHRAARFSLLDSTLNTSNAKFSPAESSLIQKARAQFGAQSPAPLVSESRQAVYQQFAGATTRRGDAEKGKTIFQERCAACHQFKGIGTARWSRPPGSQSKSQRSHLEQYHRSEPRNRSEVPGLRSRIE